MIQPVVVAVKSNADKVHRLRDYCAKLDGTELRVINLTPEMDAAFTPLYPEAAGECRAAFSLHLAAEAMRGQPFIWLEHDSIPLRAGWVQALSDAYAACRRPFLLSSDSHPPNDLVGGIGVYGPETHWMIPQHFKPETQPEKRGIGWDLWMLKHLRPLIATTPLVQHSYGIYRDDHICIRPHTFPRDAHILRKDAVIFHRCTDGSLFDSDNRFPRQIFYHSGDLGDIIYQCEVMRRMGGGILMLGSNMGLTKFNSHTREPMTLKRVDLIKPLLTSQRWCSDVFYWKEAPKPEWINLNAWRETYKGNHGKQGDTYASLQRFPLRFYGLSVQDETKPWVIIQQLDPPPKGIVIARSARYHNDNFPWRAIVNRYGNQIRFVGLRDEWTKFVADFGLVQSTPTNDLLELAKVIAGASVFIGNQSCPYAISEALKRPCVQETWPQEPNCLFERPDALSFCTDEKKIFDFIDQHL
jgi:hypothetical protein